MTVDLLREFLVLAEIGNYQKAADSLYIAQATLSRHIINLERELGITLFDRGSHTSRLSEAGQLFLPYAKKIVDLADDGHKKIQKKLHNKEGDLSIAVLHNFVSYRVADLLISFQRAYPHIFVSVTEVADSAMEQMLIDGQCSFAFITEMGNPSYDNFSREQFCEDILTACLPTTHPLAGRECVTLDQLKEENFVMASQRGLLYDNVVLACKRSGFEPKIIHSFGGNSIYTFVGSGLCVAVLLKTPAVYAHTKDTCLVDISPPIRAYVNMMYPKKQLLPKEVCFLNYARSFIDSCGK